MATDALKSQSITNLDATPTIPNTAGQGAPGRVVQVDDYVTCTVTGLQSTGSFYKLCRIPTGAVIKSVTIASDKALDTKPTAPTLALDFNLVFSDDTLPGDGTPTFLQGLVPQIGTAGTTTTLATYSSPNIVFGTTTVTTAGGGGGGAAALGPTDIIFSGSRTNYPFSTLINEPAWQWFGFTDGRGNPADPGGMFDLVAYVSTAAATGTTGALYARVTYVI